MSVDRKATFAHLIKNYHCSFTGAKNGVYEHSRAFIRKLLEAPEKGLSADAMRLDPRLTSTDTGAVAFTLAKAISEDKELAPHFLDIELADNTLVCYFEHQAKAAKIDRVLSEVGKIGILARPGDRLSEHVISDLFIIAMEPAAKVQESVVAELKKTFATKIDEIGSLSGGAEGGGSNDEMRDDDDNGTEDDEEDGGKKKKKSADKKDKDQEKDELESVRKEAKHFTLNETIFVDKLSSCKISKAEVEAVFKRYLGEKAIGHVLAETINENKVIGGDETSERDRLIRVLGARGLLEGARCHNVGGAKVMAVIEHYATVLGNKDGIAIPKSDEQYNELIEDVAFAINEEVHADELYEFCVRKTLPITLTAERVSKFVTSIKEAVAKNEQGVLISVLRAAAKVIIGEAKIAADEAEADFHLAWKAYVTEATAPLPEPLDPAAELIDALIQVPA